ncbi:MAG TPA: hypothetical protein VFQ45_23635, partial [Longimicrobium sp.]|nr:hypothetical protein [Longimicrobium sp.]
MTEPDALDRRIDAAARSYHAPGDPPLDAIWSRIEGDVAAALQAALADELAARRRGRVLRWAASAAALAASFAVGMIAGRAEDAPLSAPAPVAEAPAPSPPPAVA